MPAQYDPKMITPGRRLLYRATADYFFAPLYFMKHRMQVTGRENLPEGPCVIVGNHLSNADPPLLAVASKKPVSFIAKEELYHVPGAGGAFLRSLILTYGAISIDRDKPEVSTFKAVKEVFKNGWSLGMFIEGTRNKTPGVLGQPHEGPAYFARILKAPIVPMGIIGTNQKWGQGYVRIGKPLQPAHDLEDTTWRIMESLSELTGYALPPRTVHTSKTIVT
ncbi:MAG TPA: lysophospholipid acyltransferase family protein [Candidatus Obscuribacterales bacterium]